MRDITIFIYCDSCQGFIHGSSDHHMILDGRELCTGCWIGEDRPEDTLDPREWYLIRVKKGLEAPNYD